MGPFEFDTHARTSPSTLVWGFVRISSLRGVAAQVSCQSDGPDVASVSIFDAGPSAAADPAMVYVKMYRLPETVAEFNGDLKLIADAAESWPLGGGRAFQEKMLCPTEVPASWRHKAVQLGAAGRGIAHAWRGARSALLVRYALERGDVLDCELFQWAAKNLSVVDNAWLLDPPIAGIAVSGTAAAGAAVHASESAAPVASRERPLDAAETEQLRRSVQTARKFLELPEGASQDAVLDAIHDAVDQQRPTFRSLKENVAYNLAGGLGSLWGSVLCGAVGWQWCVLTHDGVERLAVVSPDRAHAVASTEFIYHLLGQRDGEADNTVRLLFNMISEGALPPSQPGAYRLLS